MTQVLQLTFANAENKTLTVSVSDPKPNLSEAEVTAAMQTIIEQAIFANEGFVFSIKKGARIVERHVTNLELNA